MEKKLFSLCVAILTIAVLAGCQAHTPEVIHPQFQPVDLGAKLKSGEYIQFLNSSIRNS